MIKPKTKVEIKLFKTIILLVGERRGSGMGSMDVGEPNEVCQYKDEEDEKREFESGVSRLGSGLKRSLEYD